MKEQPATMNSKAKSKQPASSRHVYKSGAAGCGGKASAVNPKNSGQVIQCGYCDRTFKQDGRYKEHLKNKHANEDLEQAQLINLHGTSSALESVGDVVNISTQGPSQSSYPVKTPKSLLHEWCQKNKKPAPRFKHVEVEGGFHCRVVLPDPKKSEADVILWYNEKAVPTAQEAQHHASVMALYHVMGDRRLDRILSYEYREQWLQLERAAEMKKSFAKVKFPKPISHASSQELQSVFMSENNRQLVEGLLLNKNDNIAKNDNAAFASVNGFPLQGMECVNELIEIDDREGCLQSNNMGSINNNGSRLKCSLKDNFEFEKGCRPNQPLGHGTLKNKGLGEKTFNTHTEDKTRSELIGMGFKEHYVSASLTKSNKLSVCLDWLMLHVPENQLPFKFAPRASKASVQVLVNKNEETVKHFPLENKSIARLCEYGYDRDHCKLALSEADGDEDIALHRLFMQTTGRLSSDNTFNKLDQNTNEVHELRSEELVALQSIFEEEAISLSLSFFKFNIKFTEASSIPLEMEVKVLPGSLYPFEIPIVAFRSPNLPSKFLLELTRNICRRAAELVGTQMIYELFCSATDEANSLIMKYSVEVQNSEEIITEIVPPACSKEGAVETFSANPCMDSFMPLEMSCTSAVTSTYCPPVRRHKHSDEKLSRQAETVSLSESIHSAQEDYQNISLQMKKEWDYSQSSPAHSEMCATRQKLPAFKKREYVVDAVNKSSVTVICGQTGCGKSTQVPQYLLEDYIDRGLGSLCNIICTEPRRVSAIGLADRVARERGEMAGETVGYSVRLESRQSSRTRILFCTTGILLRKMLSDPDLKGVTHVIVDEVHERTLEGDLLLLLLQEHLKRAQSNLRLILMSATVEAEFFACYFKQKLENKIAIVNIPGFTFPVQELYLEDVLEHTGYMIGRNSPYRNKNRGTKMLNEENTIREKEPDSWETWTEDEDTSNIQSASHYSQTTLHTLSLLDQSIVNYDLIEAIIFLITQQGSQDLQKLGHLLGTESKSENSLISNTLHFGTTGAVLIFLPGIAEIHRLQSRLRSSSCLSGIGIWVLTLHSSMSGEEQRRVFQKPPEGHRKIILATNIAETSITIDDVIYVIDTGRHKEMSYDHTKGLSCLQETWISKANAKQRRGRAGRVQPGCCFRLYSRQQFQQLAEQQLPEILRVSLDRLCLKVKAFLGGPLQDTTQRMLTSPSPEVIRASVSGLLCINALDDQECMTPLGRYLAQMPVDVPVGKMLIFGCILKCLNPILTIAAALSGRSPFLSPLDKREEANAARLNFAGSSKSDHMAIVSAYEGWIVARRDGWKAEVEYCNANFLSRESLVQMEASQTDYLKMLADIGFCSWSGKRDSSHLLDDLNVNSHNVRVVKSVVCAGFYPSIVRVRHPEKKYIQTEGGTVAKVASANEVHFFTESDGRVFLHPSSVNFSVGFFESSFLVFTEKVKTSKIFIKNCTMVPAYGLLLFGGEVKIKHEQQTIILDNWLEFEAPARISVLIKEVRSMVNSLLTEKIRNPALDISKSMVATALMQLLVTDGH